MWPAPGWKCERTVIVERGSKPERGDIGEVLFCRDRFNRRTVIGVVGGTEVRGQLAGSERDKPFGRFAVVESNEFLMSAGRIIDVFVLAHSDASYKLPRGSEVEGSTRMFGIAAVGVSTSRD